MPSARAGRRHRNLMSAIIVFVLCLFLVGRAFAEPYLQLDATDAVYLSAPEESIQPTEPAFTLYALVNSESGNIVGGDGGVDGFFYLSAALVPKQTEVTPTPNLGSFVLDGITIAVASDMSYGAPPIDADKNKDEIAGHGIFDTYYYEYEFTLAGAGQTYLYNSQDSPGGPGPDLGDDPEVYPLYFQDFEVDVSGLASGYRVHFDLYTKTLDGKLEYFAPFSHDLVTVPVPGAFLLGGIGISLATSLLKRRNLIAS